MKSTISALAVLLSASLFMALSGCTESAQGPAAQDPGLNTPVPAGMRRGVVIETMDSGGYTYVAIETDQDTVWAAGPKTAVKAGDVVQISQGMPMQQFTSKTLNRTFDVLYFVNAIENLTTPAAAAPMAGEPGAGKPAPPDVGDVSVAELEAGQNIAWLYANKDSLADQTDVANSNNDLTVTSKATTAVGETVVVSGTVVLGKDLGAGYTFPVLLEDASITTE